MFGSPHQQQLTMEFKKKYFEKTPSKLQVTASRLTAFTKTLYTYIKKPFEYLHQMNYSKPKKVNRPALSIPPTKAEKVQEKRSRKKFTTTELDYDSEQ